MAGDEKTKREEGHYWVRFGTSPLWDVMYWRDGYFWDTADGGYKADNFEIGPQVFPPGDLRSAGGAEPHEWRNLALQFDGHRIEALNMLRFAVRRIEEYATVRDILREPLATLKKFLSEPPLDGETVLANRIKGLALPPSSIETLEVRLKGLVWNGDEAQSPIGRYSVRRTEDGYAAVFEFDEIAHVGFNAVDLHNGARQAAVDHVEADYRHRVLSAIEQDQKSVPAEARILYRHQKRGTFYELIGIGKMQAETWRDPSGRDGTVYGPSVDMREVAVYRSVDHPDEIWVRPREAFEDGRFDIVGDAPEAASR